MSPCEPVGVSARFSVFSDGNDLAEFVYDGPPLTGLGEAGEAGDASAETESAIAQPKPGIWADCTVYFHAAHRAIIEGTARRSLAEDFAKSGLDYDTLAEKVGPPPRIARRIIEGKEFLRESTVAVYFEALGHRPEPQDIGAYRLEQETL